MANCHPFYLLKNLNAMTLSTMIKKLEYMSPDSPKVASLLVGMKAILKTKGDIEIDLDHMMKHLGFKLDSSNNYTL